MLLGWWASDDFGTIRPYRYFLAVLFYYAHEFITDGCVFVWQHALRRCTGPQTSVFDTAKDLSQPYGHVVPKICGDASLGVDRLPSAHVPMEEMPRPLYCVNSKAMSGCFMATMTLCLFREPLIGCFLSASEMKCDTWRL